MDDFAQQEDAGRRRKAPTGRVGEVDGPLHAVTEAKLLRELDGEPAVRQLPTVGADPFDEFAAVVGDNLGGNGLHDTGAAQVDALRRGGGDRRISDHDNESLPDVPCESSG